jgi:16S rRNA G966 N2-methylase RsmD
LGGNVLSFGLSKEIEHVIGLELDATRFKSLESNVEAFGLRSKENVKVDVWNQDFWKWYIEQGNAEKYKGSLVFLDPPW